MTSEPKKTDESRNNGPCFQVHGGGITVLSIFPIIMDLDSPPTSPRVKMRDLDDIVQILQDPELQASWSM